VIGRAESPLDELIDLQRGLAEADLPNPAYAWAELARILYIRAIRQPVTSPDAVRDLNEALMASARALELAHDGLPDLTSMMLIRHNILTIASLINGRSDSGDTQEVADALLDEQISIGRRLLLRPDITQVSVHQANLGHVLFRRHQRRRTDRDRVTPDLLQAVDLLRTALTGETAGTSGAGETLNAFVDAMREVVATGFDRDLDRDVLLDLLIERSRLHDDSEWNFALGDCLVVQWQHDPGGQDQFLADGIRVLRSIPELATHDDPAWDSRRVRYANALVEGWLNHIPDCDLDTAIQAVARIDPARSGPDSTILHPVLLRRLRRRRNWPG
jgi:hypothetical protein